MEQIKVLCRRHTDLTEADMEILERYATALQTIADMEEADIFSTVLPGTVMPL